MSNDPKGHERLDRTFAGRQQTLSLYLTFFMLVFIIAGAINGIWMTWSHGRYVSENKRLFDEQNVEIAGLQRNLRRAIREIEENKAILDSRNPKFEEMQREAEQNRRLIESMLKDRERPDSPWKAKAK